MIVGLRVVCLVVALVLFIIAAIGVGAGRVNLVAAGLGFWVAAQLVG